MQKFVPRLAALAAIFLVFASPQRAAAQDVTLTSRDGTVELSGRLLQYDGEFYRLATEYGDMTVSSEGVLCDGPGCPEAGTYVARVAVTGARDIVATLMPPLIEGFARQRNLRATRLIRDETHFTYRLDSPEGRPLAEIALRASSTAEGIADLAADEADLALALRPATAAELALAADAGAGDLAGPAQAHILGLDALVAVVSPGNPVRSVTLEELAAIHSGGITGWRDLGGPDAPITRYTPAGDPARAALFEQLVLAPAGAARAPGEEARATIAEVADAVAADPFGIAVISRSEATGLRVLALAGDCGFAVWPTPATIKSGEYPLTVRLWVYTPARRLPGLARSLVKYLSSPEAQSLLPRAGFVGQDIVALPPERDGLRLARAIRAAGDGTGLADLQRMVATLDRAARLSAVFRFEGGTTRMDARSHVNLGMLARRIGAGAYDGHELILAGFSDGEGGADANQRLARDRAATVRAALIHAAGERAATRVKFTVAGFGELAPVACDDSDWGRRANRRVEIWARPQR